MDLAIVSIAFGGYGEWLPAWAAQVAKVNPAQAIVALGKDHGATDDTVARARAILPNLTIVYSEHQTMGALLNDAIDEADAEWVMWLSIDDGIHADALDTLAAAEAGSDYICVSFDVVTGKRAPVYRAASTPAEMPGGRGFLIGHSPFRRALWVKVGGFEPTDLPTAPFNVACVKAGARFTKTTKPVTVYQRRPGSHSRILGRRKAEPGAFDKALLAEARRLTRQQITAFATLGR